MERVTYPSITAPVAATADNETAERLEVLRAELADLRKLLRALQSANEEAPARART